LFEVISNMVLKNLQSCSRVFDPESTTSTIVAGSHIIIDKCIAGVGHQRAITTGSSHAAACLFAQFLHWVKSDLKLLHILHHEAHKHGNPL
jgi:hypothetical protein